MKLSGPSRFGRLATQLAAIPVRPYYARIRLANGFAKGYVSYRACISHNELVLGRHVYIDDGVLIFKDYKGGKVELGDRVHIHRDTIIQTGQDGRVIIGQETHVQARCQFSAYKGHIVVGKSVEIAPYCAFYPYNHGMIKGVPIREQPLETRGGIHIDDEAWLGVNVIVLDGVRIGKGAVVGAGAVVTEDVPDGCVATGVPARVVKERPPAPEQA